jgi:hypothetical protein
MNRELKFKGFKYALDLCQWVNSNGVDIIGITNKDKHEGEGYVLFYMDSLIPDRKGPIKYF